MKTNKLSGIIALTVALILSLAPAARAQSGAWAWMSGSSDAGTQDVQNGVYGTIGVPSPENVPSARDTSVTWTDSSGNLWLFGGSASATPGNSSIHNNDLWEFSPATMEWTWMSGSDSTVGGVYGQLGVPAADNVPGSREGGVGWIDTAGNLWLFGGWGYDADDTFGVLNDLWEFSPATREWAWVGGSSTVPNDNDSCQSGVYGTLGVAAAGNFPGGRLLGMSWTDVHGNFWLFGGGGCDANGVQGLLNDLWQFAPATKQWTWIGGASTVEGVADGSAGIYGTLGNPAPSNFPGGRQQATTWADSSGNLWLFGGDGYDSLGQRGYLNDLWEFNPHTSQWIWISGSSVIGNDNCYEPELECAASSVYGTLGQAAAGNVPGGRDTAVGAIDTSGNLWLFGGLNEPAGIQLLLNDLWEFNPKTAEWAWMSGSNTASCAVKDNHGNCLIDGSAGVYGTLGVAAAGNVPGGRNGEVSWTGKNGNFWLFGGVGLDDSIGNFWILNDLWQYQVKQNPVASLTSSANPIFALNAVTLTATLSGNNGAPSGTVTFLDGATSIGTGTVNSSGDAKLSVTTLAVGSHTLTASYGGDTNNFAAASPPLTEVVQDFSITTGTTTTATIAPGSSASYTLTLSPIAPATAFPAAISLSASGGPGGAIYTFSPATLASGSASSAVTLSVLVPSNSASSMNLPRHPEDHLPVPLTLAVLLLPLAARVRRAGRRMGLATALFFPIAAAAMLSGCGGGAAPVQSQSQPQTYTITVTGAAGALSHSTQLSLTVN